MISMGYVNVILKVEMTWVQDPGVFPKFSWRFLLNMLSNKYMEKVAHDTIIIDTRFLEKQLMWSMLIFYNRFSMGWKLMWFI